jgi:hypothetical protein
MRRAALPLLAVAGAAIGHTVTYAVAWPDGAHRASILQDTGHAYWQAAVAAALLAGAFAAGSHVTGAVRGATPPTIARAGLHLAALQIAIFAMTEASERVAVDQPLTTLFDHHVLVIGLLVQAVMAALLVQVLRLLGRAASAVASVVAAPWTPPTAPVLAVAQATHVLPADAASGPPCGSRAPPLAA